MSDNKTALTEAVYYILLSIYHEPLHGYAMMQRINELSKGRVNLGPGTLYGALNTMIDKQWIIGVESYSDKKKDYAITALGKQIVDIEVRRLSELLENGKRIVGGDI